VGINLVRKPRSIFGSFERHCHRVN